MTGQTTNLSKRPGAVHSIPVLFMEQRELRKGRIAQR